MTSVHNTIVPLGTRRAALKRKRSFDAMEFDQDVLKQRAHPKKHKPTSNGSPLFFPSPLAAHFVVKPAQPHSLTSTPKPSMDVSQTQSLGFYVEPNVVSQQSCHTVNGTRSREWWWLPSGDIILDVDSSIFKVHKTILAEYSSVFESMFTLSAPSEENCIEDTPFVQLYDSAYDWNEVLKWMYMRPPNDAFDLTRPTVFQTIESYSNIASKYDMPALMGFAQDALLKLYTPNLLNILENDTLKRVAIDYAVESINLSRRCDMPAILPVAFFLLASADDHTQQAGLAYQLQPSDTLRLQLGRQACEQAAHSLFTTLCSGGAPVSNEVDPHVSSSRCCSIPQRVKQAYDSAYLSSSGAVAFARMLTLLANQRAAMGLCGKCALEVEIWFVQYLDGLSSCLCEWFRLD